MQRSRHYGGFNITCLYCHRRFLDTATRDEHMNADHYRYYRVVESAFRGRMQRTERVFEPNQYRTVGVMHRGEEARMMRIIDAYVHRFGSVSIMLTATGRFATYDMEGFVDDVIQVPMSSRRMQFFDGQRSRIQGYLAILMEDLQDRVDALELQGSGYTLLYLPSVSIVMNKADFAGGRPMYVSTLTERERACVTDVKSHLVDGCLFTATAQAFLPQPVKSGGASTRYHETKNYIQKFMNIKGLPKPTPLSKIRKFEKQNKRSLDFGINVYMKGKRTDHGDFGERVRQPGTKGRGKAGLGYFYYPIYVSDRLHKCRKQINLLLVGDPEKDAAQHFVFIHDLDGLLRVRSNQTVCPRCLQNVNIAAMENHQRLCCQHNPQTIKMPKPGEDGSPPLLEFVPGRRRFLNPIIGFCDFESINVKEEGGGGGGAEEEMETECRFQTAGDDDTIDGSGTCVVNAQQPIMYCMIFMSDDGRILMEKTHTSDCSASLMKRFYQDLAAVYQELGPLLNDMSDVRPFMTSRQEDEFYGATECWICEKPFITDGADGGLVDDKVLDHSHSSLQGGRYLGPAHRSCNSGRQHQKQIPIFMHNLTNYDGMFLLNALSDEEISQSWQISGIPMNTEKFRTLNIGDFKFLDSLHFLSSSLAKLVDDLVRDGHEFPILKSFKHGRLDGGVDSSLLTMKSCYPYDYATSLQLLKDSQYPAYENFYNKMQQKNISLELYEHGRAVYQAAACSSLEDYTLLYNRLDVYLLAEVVTNFRRHTYDEFRLDVSQFLSAPHLSFNIMLLLNSKRYKVELVTDPEMHLMVESGLRGGVTHAALRHAKLPEPYTEETDPTLLYTDCVNLYGHAMRQKLPLGGYEWLEEEELEQRDWSRASDDDEFGYIVECDLEYPQQLHDAHDSLPLAPEQRELKYSMLSEYSKCCFKQSKPRLYKKHTANKLCSTFLEKQHYVVHSRNLALYLQLGMVLKKVRRAIKFKQAAWLKEYIDLMTAKRQNARSIFEKAFYKLLINSIYGKLVQNVRKQMNCVFVQSEKQLTRALANPCFEHYRIIGENCVVFFNRKRIVQMNKPYIAGFSVLDLSKCHMFDLFYNRIKPVAPNAQVVLTDTDSLLLHVPDMSKPSFFDACGDVFDFSNYPTAHPRHSTAKKMIPGYLKDENASKPLVEVVALKAKVYAIRTEHDEVVEKKCKGIAKRIVERDFTFDTYLTSLSQVSTLRATSFRLRSKNYKIDLIKSRKVGLTTGDDKRFLLPCGIHTLAHGSYRIKEKDTPCHVCQTSVCDMKNKFLSEFYWNCESDEEEEEMVH